MLIKVAFSLLEPLGLLWMFLALLAGWQFRRRQFSWAMGTAAGWWMLTAATCIPLPSLLLSKLEGPWAGTDLAQVPRCDAIVVLGGGVEPSHREIVGLHFKRATDRLITAIELARRDKGGALVIGGGGYPDADGAALLPEADLTRDWIESWQTVTQPVLSLGVCADTHDEAAKVSELARSHGWKTVLLVTSASHMKRAEATFKKAGLEVACAPCNYESSHLQLDRLTWFHTPENGGLEMCSIWLHETVGWWFYRWRGWI